MGLTIIRAGTMGRGIAQVTFTPNISLNLSDIDYQILETARTKTQKRIAKDVKKHIFVEYLDFRKISQSFEIQDLLRKMVEGGKLDKKAGERFYKLKGGVTI